jgi:hypothetical protein
MCIFGHRHKPGAGGVRIFLRDLPSKAGKQKDGPIHLHHPQKHHDSDLVATVINVNEGLFISITLEELGHKQPPTPMESDNSMIYFTQALFVLDGR